MLLNENWWLLFTFGSKSINIVDLSDDPWPKSLLALTMHFMNFLFRADFKATCRDGGLTSGAAQRTVSSLSATVPRALLASCSVSSSSRQKVSHETCWTLSLFYAYALHKIDITINNILRILLFKSISIIHHHYLFFIPMSVWLIVLNLYIF